MADPAGSWNEYQRLVLSELNRLNDAGVSLDQNQRNFDLRLDRQERSIQELQRTILDLQKSQVDALKAVRDTQIEHGQQLQNIGTTDISERAVKKYKRWLVGIGIGFAAIFTAPIVTIIIAVVIK